MLFIRQGVTKIKNFFRLFLIFYSLLQKFVYTIFSKQSTNHSNSVKQDNCSTCSHYNSKVRNGEE